MSTKRPLDQHLTSEEAFRFKDKSLTKRQSREVEDHLDECLDCVEYLAAVARSTRPVTREEEEALSHIPARTPQELLERLRPQIAASSPGAARPRRTGFQWDWSKLVPAAAAAAVLLTTFVTLQYYVIGPARGRQMAATAMGNLVTLRQETGRVPLRYIPEFKRARVTRSAFDTVHPGEAAVEEQLRQAADLAPNALETRLALGLFLLDKGALDEAESNLGRALELEPGSTLATNGLAVVYYERAIRNAPQANALLRKGIALLQSAKRESPDDLQVAFNLAMLYQESGAKAVAREHWTTYLEMDPDSEWGDVATEKLEDLGGPDEPEIR